MGHHCAQCPTKHSGSAGRRGVTALSRARAPDCQLAVGDSGGDISERASYELLEFQTKERVYTSNIPTPALPLEGAARSASGLNKDLKGGTGHCYTDRHMYTA